MSKKMSVEQALDVLAKGEWPIDLVVEASQALATLRAELDGLRADAARYRWLRDDPPVSLSVRSLNRYGEFFYVDGNVLDAAIDTALDRARKVSPECTCLSEMADGIGPLHLSDCPLATHPEQTP